MVTHNFSGSDFKSPGLGYEEKKESELLSNKYHEISPFNFHITFIESDMISSSCSIKFHDKKKVKVWKKEIKHGFVSIVEYIGYSEGFEPFKNLIINNLWQVLNILLQEIIIKYYINRNKTYI